MTDFQKSVNANLVKLFLHEPLVATRFNQRIKGYYQHLLAKGKQKKVALVACMRKLLTILNTLVKKMNSGKTK